MDVLLTGGSGFLGKYMAAFLLRQGVTVIAIGRNACPVPGVRNLIVPALTAASIQQALSDNQIGIDALVHLAAAGVRMSDRDFPILMDTNVVLPGQLVRIAAQHGARAMVMAGSCAEYQLPIEQRLTVESDPLQMEAPYGATKAAGGICALSIAAELHVPLAWMRVFNLYGAGELPHRLFPAALTSMQRGQPIRIRAGHQVRDFLYVADACEGLWVALTGLLAKKIVSGPYQLCTGTGTSVKEFVLALARCLGNCEKTLQFDVSPLPTEESEYLVGDTTLFHAASGWTAQYTVEQGLLASLAS